MSAGRATRAGLDAAAAGGDGRPRSPSSTSAPTRSGSSSTSGCAGRRSRCSTRSRSARSAGASPPPAGSVATEMDSALHALRRFAHIAGALRAGEVEYVATEAVRQAENGAEFLAEAERATGQPVAVLSGHDEAHSRGHGRRLQLPPAARRGGRSRRRQRRPVGGDARRARRTLWQPADRHAAGHPHAARARRRRRPASIDERLAGVSWLGGRRRRPELLRRRRRLAGAGARPAGHDRHAAQGRPRLPPDRRRGDHARPQHRGAGPRGAADRARHARAADRDGAGGRPAARAGRAPAGARSGRVLGLRPARGPRFRAPVGGGAGQDPLLAGAEDFGRTRSRLPEIGAAMGELDRRRRRRRNASSSGGCGSPCARSPTAPGASTRPFAPARRSTGWRSTRSSARPRRAGVHRLCRVHPLRGQPRRPVHPADPDRCCRRPSGAAPSSWAPRCSWAIGSRPPCPSCWRPVGCALPATSCAWTCPHPTPHPTPRSSSPRLRAVAKALGSRPHQGRDTATEPDSGRGGHGRSPGSATPSSIW